MTFHPQAVKTHSGALFKVRNGLRRRGELAVLILLIAFSLMIRRLCIQLILLNLSWALRAALIRVGIRPNTFTDTACPESSISDTDCLKYSSCSSASCIILRSFFAKSDLLIFPARTARSPEIFLFSRLYSDDCNCSPLSEALLPSLPPRFSLLFLYSLRQVLPLLCLPLLLLRRRFRCL